MWLKGEMFNPIGWGSDSALSALPNVPIPTRFSSAGTSGRPSMEGDEDDQRERSPANLTNHNQDARHARRSHLPGRDEVPYQRCNVPDLSLIHI